MDQHKSNQIVLNGTNYATWKIQCRMALMKDGLWVFVNGMEKIPDENDDDACHKYQMKRDRALATIVLAMNPSLLYLLGDDPQDPSVVWKKLSDQFQKRTWANKLDLLTEVEGKRINSVTCQINDGNFSRISNYR